MSIQKIGADTSGISPGRIAVIHDRIGRGFYDHPAVVEQVARNLLASGDLKLDLSDRSTPSGPDDPTNGAVGRRCPVDGA